MVYPRDIETQTKLGKKVSEIRINKLFKQGELAYKSDLDISKVNRIRKNQWKHFYIIQNCKFFGRSHQRIV